MLLCVLIDPFLIIIVCSEIFLSQHVSYQFFNFSYNLFGLNKK